jgi:formyl-CoA transferase
MAPLIMHGFRAKDGWFILQVGRQNQFDALVNLIGHPEWSADPRFATRQGWIDHLESTLRPGIEQWAADMTKTEVCHALGRVGLASGPVLADEEVVNDPHVKARNMLIAIERTDGIEQPVLTPGNPVRLSELPPPPYGLRVPWLGEHTDAVLTAELGLSEAAITELREAGVIA